MDFIVVVGGHTTLLTLLPQEQNKIPCQKFVKVG